MGRILFRLIRRIFESNRTVAAMTTLKVLDYKLQSISSNV